MYVQGKVNECDFSDRKYDTAVDGVHVVAQGATGRWCCVMYMGPEEMVRQGIQEHVLTHEQATAQVEAKGDGGWVEF